MHARLAGAFQAGDAAGVVDTLADHVVLRVAVHAEPFEGKPTAAAIIGAVLDGVMRDIQVAESLVDGANTVTVFSTRIADHPGRADGLLLARSDVWGRIVELTVFLRPLAALQALADEMGRRLGGPMPGGA